MSEERAAPTNEQLKRFVYDRREVLAPAEGHRAGETDRQERSMPHVRMTLCDVMHAEGKLTGRQHEASRLFAEAWSRGQFCAQAANLEEFTDEGFASRTPTDEALEARTYYRQAIRSIPHRAISSTLSAAIDEIPPLKISRLREGLDALADFFDLRQ